MAATTHSPSAVPNTPAARLGRGAVGALAGLLAGVVYAALLTSQQMSPMMNPTDLPGDTAVHLALSALIGLIFGLSMGAERISAGRSLIWGAAAGMLWWLLGPLTLFPLLHNARPTWSIASAQAAFPLLIGLAVVFGVCLGLLHWLLLTVIDGIQARRFSVAPALLQGAISGGVAGLIGGWVFGRWMEEAGLFPLIAGLVNATDPNTGRWLHFLISVVIGVTYGVLFQRDIRTTGASIAWGIIYGLVWWVIGALTILPLLLGDGVQWSLAAAQGAFASLIGHLVYGIALGMTQAILSLLWRTLFVVSDPLLRQPEGPGTRVLRGLGVGVAASVVGGLAFTVVMVATDALPVVATLAGMDNALTGFVVHMLISAIIGAAYGLIFRSETSAPHTAVGWGMVYGVIWWLLGPLTLMPVLLGLPLEWSLESAAGAFPSLVGHVLYGVGLAVVFQRLLARSAPASAPDSSSGYPIWLLVTLLTILILLSVTGQPAV